MLRSIIDVEDHRYLRIEAVDAERREIRLRVEDKAVRAVRDRAIHQEERFHAPVCVGPCMTQLGPTLVGVLNLETDRDTARRRSSRSVENMRGDGTHVRA